MFSRLLMPLSRVVRREIRDWRKVNFEHRRTRGGWFERSVFFASASLGRIFLYWLIGLPTLAFVFYSGAAYIGWPSDEQIPFPGSNLDRLLGVQATLTALTYPIVLALVGILLKRSWTDLRVRVYLAYSSALLAVTSALLFIAIIATYVHLVPTSVSPSLHTIAALTFLAWFLANIGLTANFLYRSLRYLAPSEQQRSLLLYTATTIWPNELQARLMQLRWHGAPELDWPPNAGNNEFPSVHVTYVSPRDAGTEVKCEARTPRWLRDVWLRPLTYVARRWQARSSEPPSDRHPGPGATTSHWLTFPVSFGRVLNASDDLCRRRGTEGLQPFERWLVRMSIRLSGRVPRAPGLTITSVIEELGDLALAAMQADREITFSHALQNLLEFHATVIQLGDGNVHDLNGNYLTMLNNPDGSMQTLDQSLLDPYRRIAMHAVWKQEGEPDYLRITARCAESLLARVRKTAPMEIRTQLQFIAAMHWSALGEQWSSYSPDLAESVNMPTSISVNSGSTNKPDHAKKLRTLCAAWDYLSYQILRDDDHDEDWSSLSHRGQECVRYLEYTLKHVVTAFFDDHALAARWALDLVQRWPGYWYGIRVERAALDEFPQLGEGAFHLTWPTIEQQLGIRGETLRSTDDKRLAVVAQALVNGWRDACAFLLAWLIGQSADAHPRKKLPLSLAKALATRELLAGAGSSSNVQKPFSRFDQAIASWLRTNFLGGGPHNLVGGLSQRLGEATKDRHRASWVHGRSYVTDDGATTLDLSEATLVFLIWAAQYRDSISQQTSDTLLAFVEQDAALSERVTNRLDNTITRLLKMDITSWLPVLKYLLPSLDHAALEAAKQHVAEQLTDLLKRIQVRHDERLTVAQIDPNRIDRITAACNRLAFDRDRGAVPLPYFNEVETVDADIPECTQELPTRNKAELVSPPLATSSTSEYDWYAQMARDLVAMDVRQKLRRELRTTNLRVRTEREFAEQIRAKAAELRGAGLEPLFFVAHHRDLYGRWRSPRSALNEQRIGGLTLRKHDGFVEPGYLTHVDDIPAIDMPIINGSAFLLPRECFERLEFKSQRNGQPARLDLHEQPESRVDLTLVWCARVTLRPLPAFRFFLGNSR